MTIRRLLCALALCLSLYAAGTGVPTNPQWHDDLRYFQRELERRHKNAFHFTSREKFEAAVADLDRRLDSLNYDQICVGFAKLAALIGDAHTSVVLPPTGAHGAFPIRVRDYGDDVRVIAVAPGLEKALGTRLVKIQDTPVAEARNALVPLFAQDEHPWWHRAVATLNLIHAGFLHGLNIIPQADAARYTFAGDDGSEFTLDLKPQTVAEQRQVQFIPLAKNALEDQWEAVHRPAETFTYRYIPHAGAVYANVRSMRSLSKPASELLAFVRQKQAIKLIVDLRQNPGGDYFQGLHHLIEPIRKLAAINRKGHLFVLIGTFTASAAMNDASFFHTKTEAILVGEPIGTKPTEYSERRQMKLPNSHMLVNYSVRFYQFAYNDENVIRPDQEIVPSWEAAKAGHDQVVEWCLNYGIPTAP